jgi:hypothetical protein
MKATVVFDGQEGLRNFISIANKAIEALNDEIEKRKQQKSETDKQVDVYRALPWYKRLVTKEPCYSEDMLWGLSSLARYRKEIKALIESAKDATAVHMRNDDLDCLMSWTK